jgi:hypothetical protein
MTTTPAMIFMTRLDARLPPRDATSIGRRRSEDATEHARQPLGLAPAPGDDADDATGRHLMDDGALDHGPIVDIAGLDPAERDAPADVRLVYLALNAAASAADTVHARAKERDAALETELAAVRKELAELRATLVEARHETRELKLVQESMRIANRGERGCDGARGVPGRDGQQGPQGPRGERGEAGARAAGFITNPEEFSAVLQITDGTPGPTLRLRPLFEAYDSQTNGDEG